MRIVSERLSSPQNICACCCTVCVYLNIDVCSRQNICVCCVRIKFVRILGVLLYVFCTVFHTPVVLN